MNVAELIRTARREGRTRFAFELLPPLKGAGLQGVFAAIDAVTAFDPAYINVTFHRETVKEQAAGDGRTERHVMRRRPGTVGVSAAIRQRYGIEVVPHLICGGLSRYDIEDALIDLDFLGLNNVLALRGDKSPSEAAFTPHPQGHRHALGLVQQIAAMNRGEFVDGEVDECHHSRFTIGVAGYPETHADAPDPESDIRHLKAKIDAGAEYIVTQLFFDNAKFFDFEARCRQAGIDVPIVPGLKPLATPKHLTLLPQTFRTSLPEALVREVERRPEHAREIGIEWTIAQSRELKAAGVPVIHYYTMSRTESIRRIAEALF